MKQEQKFWKRERLQWIDAETTAVRMKKLCLVAFFLSAPP